MPRGFAMLDLLFITSENLLARGEIGKLVSRREEREGKKNEEEEKKRKEYMF